MEKSRSSATSNMVSQLAATQLSGLIDRAIVQVIASSAEPVTLSAGELLFQQGDPSDALFVVLWGQLAAILTMEDEGEKVIGQIGPIIASDVSAPVDLQTTAEFGPYLSGWQLLWQRLNPFAQAPAIPSLGATILRSSLLSSAQALDLAKAMANIYIYPPVEKYGTLEFLAPEAIVDIGYVHAHKMIAEWQEAGKLDIFFSL